VKIKLPSTETEILCVVANTGGGGAEKVAALLADEWSKTGKVRIATFERHQREYPTVAEILDLQCGFAPGMHMKLLRLLQRLVRLRQVLVRTKPSRIVSFTEGPNIVTLLAAISMGRLNSTTISVHADPKFWSPEHRLLCRLLYRIAPKIVVGAGGIKKYLCDEIGIKPERVVVIPNPIPIQSARVEPMPELSEGRPFILGVGRLEYEKGFDLLIRAFASSGINSEFILRLVGDGSKKNDLINLCQALGVRDKVVFHGWQTDVGPFYFAAKGLVVPSRTEAFGNVIVEAMAAGCPIVAFDCDYGPREIITHNQTGFLVNRMSVEALAAGLKNLSAESEGMPLMIKKARLRAFDFDPKKIADSWLSASFKLKSQRAGSCSDFLDLK